MRKAEMVRDRIMHATGTSEPWITEDMSAEIGMRALAIHYRKPLTFAEVAQMGRTPETLTRPGRA